MSLIYTMYCSPYRIMDDLLFGTAEWQEKAFKHGIRKDIAMIMARPPAPKVYIKKEEDRQGILDYYADKYGKDYRIDVIVAE